MNEKYLKVPTVGEIIKEEFLEPMNLSGYELAKKMEVPYSRINDILNGKRQITIDTAIRLSIVLELRLSYGQDYKQMLMQEMQN
ncbi:HigA family addiction module antitoxin [Fructilactobacillus frigidiflavus]|uniref:HigA family addiction module antitoxin n=1 Tax=Fructilactobacillus frigidiflavus TaxID=3242688 RepID=UPI0037578A98